MGIHERMHSANGRNDECIDELQQNIYTFFKFILSGGADRNMDILIIRTIMKQTTKKKQNGRAAAG